MKIRDRPIPALYCVYLLRSTEKKTAFYVGSTPNPRRRLKQHNGIMKGGANRTSTKTHRPWQMITLISGFPSKLAALQFEWAWQNTHISRHIPKEYRSLTKSKPRTRRKASGEKYQTVGKSIDRSEGTKIRTLQILLRAISFRRWPLRVHFYAKSCHDFWTKPSIVGGLCTWNGIIPALDDSVDKPQASTRGHASFEQRIEAFMTEPTTRAIFAIDASYNVAKAQLQRSIETLGSDELLSCAICSETLQAKSDKILVCCVQSCRSTSHLSCLGQSFLERDLDARRDTVVKQDTKPEPLLPVSGRCPTCSTELQWIDLVKDLSLRMRPLKRVKKIPKGAASSKDSNPGFWMGEGSCSTSILDFEEDVNDDDDTEDETDDDIGYDAGFAEDVHEDLDCALNSSEASEDDSLPKPARKKTKKQSSPAPKDKAKFAAGITIPDSDGYDEIEEIG